MQPEISVFWFRRDLRFDDNSALSMALKSGRAILPVFIFDSSILDDLPHPFDRRVIYIHQRLQELQKILLPWGSSLHVYYGSPLEVWKSILEKFHVSEVFVNEDYEPYGIKRDAEIKQFLSSNGIPFHGFSDHVIFHPSSIFKRDGTPYRVFTAYKKVWLASLKDIPSYPSENLMGAFYKDDSGTIVSPQSFGFTIKPIRFPFKLPDLDILKNYASSRDFPAMDATSHVGIHLRFGSMSIRQLLRRALPYSGIYVNELIWREFYMMILYHFPRLVHESYNSDFRFIEWSNDEFLFGLWKDGRTGYPMVDAGMRQLKETGWMHNRLRMITASFLVKHLLIDWRWGEQWFADNLIDFELSSNNGGWQWSAGTGTDAVPYFRVFSPTAQQKRFDADFTFIKAWLPEYDSPLYPNPVVQHSSARLDAINAFRDAKRKNV